MLCYGLLKVRKVPLESLLYFLFIQINITIKFMKKLEIWKRMFKIGNPIEFLGLGDINFIKEMAVHLRDHNGIENFKRLVEMRLR